MVAAFQAALLLRGKRPLAGADRVAALQVQRELVQGSVRERAASALAPDQPGVLEKFYRRPVQCSLRFRGYLPDYAVPQVPTQRFHMAE